MSRMDVFCDLVQPRDMLTMFWNACYIELTVGVMQASLGSS